MSQKKIRWGILGTGAVSRAFAAGLRGLDDAELAAIGSRSAATARSFAEAFGIPKAYDSYDALAADPDIDIVYIATPYRRHKDDCLLMLGAGKAVICEKPFAGNAAEAREVVEFARARNLFCMEAMWMRFMPLIQEVAALLKAGCIGEVRLLTADNGRAVRYDPGHRIFRPEEGGSVLLDRGVYPLALAQHLLGPLPEAQGQIARAPTGVDEQATMVLRYEAGALAVLTSSLTAHASNEVTIAGTHGRLHIHAPYYNPTRVTIIRSEPRAAGAAAGAPRRPTTRQRIVEGLKLSPAAQWVIGAIGESRWPRRKGSKQVIFRPLSGNGYHYQAIEAMRCLRAGLTESPLMPLDDSLELMAAIDSFKASR